MPTLPKNEVTILPEFNWSARFIRSVYNILATLTSLFVIVALDSVEYENPKYQFFITFNYVFTIPMYLLMLTLNLIDWKINQIPSLFKAESVRDEIEKSNNIVRQIIDFEQLCNLTDRLKRINPLDRINADPHRFTFFEARGSHPAVINLKLGDEIILRKCQLAKTILNELMQCGNLPKDIKKDIKNIICPSFLNPIRSYLPYKSKEFSFPTKLRYINSLIYVNLLPLFNSEAIEKKYGVDQVIIKSLSLSLALATALACALDSYNYNQRHIRLELQGYSVIQRPYEEWPPTCIGRQFANKWTLYPSNPMIKEALTFINKIQAIVPEHKFDESKMPKALKDAIFEFRKENETNQIKFRNS